ncbi:hypothetical protein J6TS2_33490 [Heyndrickxia sporothermodurans]|nr:hypothetical protein J6TS2_33490 [Heyndrickxia sporothermodurans]
MEQNRSKRKAKVLSTSKNFTEITEWYQKKRDFYKRLAIKVELIIKEILDNEKIIYHDLTSRAKDVESFLDKASKEKYIDPANEIMDLAGIRVTAYVESDVKKICEIIESEFKIYEEHSGDKSENLAENQVGYRSVHYVAEINSVRSDLPEYHRFQGVPFEIQVRTILQHAWAEIEHDRNYKLKGELPEKRDIKRRFSLLAAVLEMADREFDSIVNDIDIYIEDVKAETKKGYLQIPIDSISLKEYLDNKLSDVDIKSRELSIDQSTSVNELKRFGIDNLSMLDKLINQDFIEKFKEITPYPGNYLSFLRILMITTDVEKYFDKAKIPEFTAVKQSFANALVHFGININTLEKYRMEIYAS